ncbi:MAG: FCD domain-containing protein [Streptosporangiales bacterium]|nr:FCD domain-containing protein [Streptosporangiales bacterium]
MAAQIDVPRQALLERLTNELLDGGTEPGAKLPSERQLAERFHISRPVVREVLRELQERGLVEISPGRGTFVRAVGALDAGRLVEVLYRRGQTTPRQLVEARTMLEGQAAALAAERATDDDVAAMGRALEGFDRATGVIGRAKADIAFHALLARASHNPVLDIMFGSISGLVFEQMLRSLDDPHVAAEGVPYHRQVLAAIENRDAAAAGAAMTEHLTLALRTYGSDLDESLERIAMRKVDDLLGKGASLQSVISSALSQFTEDAEERLIGGGA